MMLVATGVLARVNVNHHCICAPWQILVLVLVSICMMCCKVWSVFGRRCGDAIFTHILELSRPPKFPSRGRPTSVRGRAPGGPGASALSAELHLRRCPAVRTS